MKLHGINHLAFITGDMEKTIRFYRDLLGLTLSAGVGHNGLRHYFFRFGDDKTHVAFFEYDGASPMKFKFPGKRTSEPLGFDHVSFTVGGKKDLFALKDKLEAAGFGVRGAIDHGMFWSIYFRDPNNIPLEATWEFMAIKKMPAMAEDEPMDIVAEGAEPQPGHWPEVTDPTPPDAMTSTSGNAYRMRKEFLDAGVADFKDEFEEIPPVKAAE